MIWLAIPFGIQGLLMLVDEFAFHHRRGLPAWERWGHPLDTVTVLAAFSVPAFLDLERLWIYVCLSAFSCLFVTKDEWVHTVECDAVENWIHSLMFVLHPIAFGMVGWFWLNPGENAGFFRTLMKAQLLVVTLILIYQVVYWNFIRKPKHV